MIWARAVLLHFGPPLLHMLYLAVYKKEISAAYRGRTSLLLKFWSAVAGYLAMGLMWEQVCVLSAGVHAYMRACTRRDAREAGRQSSSRAPRPPPSSRTPKLPPPFLNPEPKC